MTFSAVIEKVKDIISTELGERRVLDKDVAHALALDETRLSKLKRKDQLPYKELALFAAKRKLSINWLLFDQEPKQLEEQTEKFVRIKYLSSVKAGAGGGCFNDDGYTYGIEVSKEALQRLHISNTDNIEAIRAAGDSMSVTIEDGAILLVDTKAATILPGQIYVVSTSEGCLVKRIYIGDGYVKLVSDNRTHGDVFLFDEEVKICGAVLAVGYLN